MKITRSPVEPLKQVVSSEFVDDVERLQGSASLVAALRRIAVPSEEARPVADSDDSPSLVVEPPPVVPDSITTRREPNFVVGESDGVHWRTLLRLGLRALAITSVLTVALTILAVVAALSHPYSTTADVAVSADIGLSLTTFWATFLISRPLEPIAEWRIVLSDQAAKADSVYSYIIGTLRNQQVPIVVTLRRIRTGPGRLDVSNRIRIQHQSYTIYVSVFPYGKSLYVGWAMFRRRSGASMLKRFFADLIIDVTGHRDIERQLMPTERLRAICEALTDACTEALSLASQEVEVPVAFGFPIGLPPIEDNAWPDEPAVPGAVTRP